MFQVAPVPQNSKGLSFGRETRFFFEIYHFLKNNSQKYTTFGKYFCTGGTIPFCGRGGGKVGTGGKGIAPPPPKSALLLETQPTIFTSNSYFCQKMQKVGLRANFPYLLNPAFNAPLNALFRPMLDEIDTPPPESANPIRGGIIPTTENAQKLKAQTTTLSSLHPPTFLNTSYNTQNITHYSAIQSNTARTQKIAFDCNTIWAGTQYTVAWINMPVVILPKFSFSKNMATRLAYIKNGQDARCMPTQIWAHSPHHGTHFVAHSSNTFQDGSIVHITHTRVWALNTRERSRGPERNPPEHFLL